MAVGVGRVDRELDRSIVGQDGTRRPASKIVRDHEARAQKYAAPVRGGYAQRLGAVGDEVAGSPKRCRLSIRDYRRDEALLEEASPTPQAMIFMPPST
jgi:hypothetical protein